MVDEHLAMPTINVRRTRRIFQSDGHALICALDHGMIFGPDAGIERLADTLPKIIAGGVDAVMCSYGTATRFAGLLAGVGLVLRMDGAATVLGPKGGPGAAFYTIEDALRLGADALCVSAFPGSPVEEATLQTLAHAICQAHTWGLPVMAEMVPGGFDSDPHYRTLEAIGISARVAAELGADWVKVPYVEGFERVVETCYVPVLVLGGSHQADVQATLTMVEQAMQAGAAGAVVGRNIWKAEDPCEMARNLGRLVHASSAGPTRAPHAL